MMKMRDGVWHEVIRNEAGGVELRRTSLSDKVAEPETEAGRRMLHDWQSRRTHPPTAARQESYRQLILAIEAEVRATLAAKVRALPGVSIGEGIYPEYVRREYVLALIEGSDPASPEAALDVERLARALHKATSHYQGTVNPETEAHRVQHEYDARAVIAAYEADGRG